MSTGITRTHRPTYIISTNPNTCTNTRSNTFLATRPPCIQCSVVKINVIVLNIKINRPKLVNMCGYKFASNWQNSTKIHLAWVKILQKVLGRGATFWLTLYMQLIYQNWTKHLVASEVASDTFNTLIDSIPREVSTGTGQCWVVQLKVLWPV